MPTIAISVALALAAISSGEKARLDAAARIVQGVHDAIPADYWSRARCVLVIPELKKAALVVGGEYGKGVMSCRAGNSSARWSAPMFMQLAKGSWGVQLGAEQVDLVLLVMNEQGVQKLLQNKVALGADASVAAGPLGRQGQLATDAHLTAEMIAYSHAQGLFAGVDLSGGVLRPDEDANRSAYGARATPRSILASRDISAPTEAQAFLNALGKGNTAVSERDRDASSAQPPSSTPAPARAAAPSGDDDARARIVSLQQAVDRLLGPPSAAGTSGTNQPADARPGVTVTVDRAQLVQIRQQLDALLASLDRK